MDLLVLHKERYQKSSWKILNYENTRLNLPTKPEPDLFESKMFTISTKLIWSIFVTWQWRKMEKHTITFYLCLIYFLAFTGCVLLKANTVIVSQMNWNESTKCTASLSAFRVTMVASSRSTWSSFVKKWKLKWSDVGLTTLNPKGKSRDPIGFYGIRSIMICREIKNTVWIGLKSCRIMPNVWIMKKEKSWHEKALLRSILGVSRTI